MRQRQPLQKLRRKKPDRKRKLNVPRLLKRPRKKDVLQPKRRLRKKESLSR